MASISNDPNGRKRLHFFDPDGKRRVVRLGKMSKRNAESIKTHVEHLLSARISKQPLDGETARWVVRIDDVLSVKLARVGLIQAPDSSLLAEYIDGYVKRRTDLKPRTVKKFRATRDYLVDFLSADRQLRDVTPTHGASS
jgi:hypothetical protein